MGELVGVVLAAGAGSRLAPLTRLKPKALCPVDNRPLVDWALDRVLPHCASVAVNIHHHRRQMLEHLDDRQLHLSVETPVALGTAGALGQLRPWIAGRDVLLTNADAWEPDGSRSLESLIAAWDGIRPRLRCVTARKKGDFGSLRYVGSALLPWWSIADLPPEPAGLFEASWGALYEDDRLELATVDEVVPVDCGTPSNYLAANLAASGGRSVVDPGAVVEGSIDRCVVWPKSRVHRGERLVCAIRAENLTIQVSDPAARGE